MRIQTLRRIGVCLPVAICVAAAVVVFHVARPEPPATTIDVAESIARSSGVGPLSAEDRARIAERCGGGALRAQPVAECQIVELVLRPTFARALNTPGMRP